MPRRVEALREASAELRQLRALEPAFLRRFIVHNAASRCTLPSQCHHSVGCRINGLAKKGIVSWQHTSSLPVIWSSFNAAFLSLELHQASTQSCARCLQGLTACNIRCKATGSRTDVLPQSINSFRPYRQATRERRKMPFPDLHIKSRVQGCNVALVRLLRVEACPVR